MEFCIRVCILETDRNPCLLLARLHLVCCQNTVFFFYQIYLLIVVSPPK